MNDVVSSSSAFHNRFSRLKKFLKGKKPVDMRRWPIIYFLFCFTHFNGGAREIGQDEGKKCFGLKGSWRCWGQLGNNGQTARNADGIVCNFYGAVYKERFSLQAGLSCAAH